MYKRKTRDVYNIVTNYGYGWEVEFCANNYENARAILRDYKGNTNAQVRIERKREKI